MKYEKSVIQQISDTKNTFRSINIVEIDWRLVISDCKIN